MAVTTLHDKNPLHNVPTFTNMTSGDKRNSEAKLQFSKKSLSLS